MGKNEADNFDEFHLTNWMTFSIIEFSHFLFFDTGSRSEVRVNFRFSTPGKGKLLRAIIHSTLSTFSKSVSFWWEKCTLELFNRNFELQSVWSVFFISLGALGEGMRKFISTRWNVSFFCYLDFNFFLIC